MNIILSQEMFSLIGCFEITLRNKIDRHYLNRHGNDWIRDSIRGFFVENKFMTTKMKIQEKLDILNSRYSHDNIIAEMEFSFWRYLFSSSHFFAAGSSLLKIFPSKPKSGPLIQYNHSYVFDSLKKINDLRNRIAHHEPICFRKGTSTIDTTYARRLYADILELFRWMRKLPLSSYASI